MWDSLMVISAESMLETITNDLNLEFYRKWNCSSRIYYINETQKTFSEQISNFESCSCACATHTCIMVHRYLMLVTTTLHCLYILCEKNRLTALETKYCIRVNNRALLNHTRMVSMICAIQQHTISKIDAWPGMIQQGRLLNFTIAQDLIPLYD